MPKAKAINHKERTLFGTLFRYDRQAGSCGNVTVRTLEFVAQLVEQQDSRKDGIAVHWVA